MAKRSRPGIMCLEGEWTSKLTERWSVQPVLDLLERHEVINYVYRDIGTVEELNFYIQRWLQKQYSDYRVAYLAFHGAPGEILIGRKRVTLDDLADLIDGRASGRVIHFGSCSTIDLEEVELQRFLQMTKAKAVCGYREDVDFVEAAAFETLLIDALSWYKRIDAVDRYLRKNHEGFCRALQYRMVWR